MAFYSRLALQNVKPLNAHIFMTLCSSPFLPVSVLRIAQKRSFFRISIRRNLTTRTGAKSSTQNLPKGIKYMVFSIFEIYFIVINDFGL